MKVLWFSPTPCGSVLMHKGIVINGGWLISLEEELKKFPNIDLHVAFFAGKRERAFKFEGVTYYPMGFEKRPSPIMRVLNRMRSVKNVDKARLPWMLDVIEQSHPDIIHIHGSEGRFITIMPYVKNIPVVVSIQGMIASLREKFFAGFPKNVAYSLDSITDRIHLVGIRKDWKSFQQRVIRECEYLSRTQYVFGRTFWDYNCTLALNPQRKYYVVNEIMRQPFYHKQWKGIIDKEKVHLISTISGGIYKGFETVLKTASLLKERSNIDFLWHIVGFDDKYKWVQIAEKMTGLMSKEVNISFHGRKNADELVEILCKSDIYVHVSHIENSPNCVCEAMLVGMPIIASYAGGTASLLEHEKEGVLVQDGDPYVLAGAIVNFVQNPDKAIMFAKKARERALIRHDKQSVIGELLSGYTNIIKDFHSSQ